MNSPNKILIVRTDRIGDVVLTLPLAKYIKKFYPKSHVTFLVREYTSPLTLNNKFIDNTIILPEKDNQTDFFKVLSILKSEKFDTAIMVYPRFKISLALKLAGIKKRIGSGYRWFSFLFTDKVYEHRKTGDKHELEHNLTLLKKLGITDIEKTDVSFDIHISEKSRQKADQIFEVYNIPKNKKIIIIHPGSGGSSIDLPISKFSSLSYRLAHELDCIILITGSQSEKTTCDKIMNELNSYNLAGKLTLEELTAVIDKSNMLIANSTGPIHIAAALGKNVVGFYPKIKECSVERWGPYTNKKLIFTPPIECENCTREQCEKLDCMNSIDIDNVYSEIKNLLN